MLPIPTYDELLYSAQQAVEQRCGITNFSESSVAGALIKVFCAKLTDLYDIMAQLDSQGNLSTAVGDYLDKIGDLFGVKRLQAKAATTVGLGSAVKFTNSTTSTQTIPAGTRIWSALDPRVSYLTEYAITIASGEEAYVDVTAVSPGLSYNVGTGSLTVHDLGLDNITVTNVMEINSGTSVESDDNYRYRISNALLTQQGSNEISIRIKLLEIPGVRDVVLQPLARGTGTIDVTILPVDRKVSAELLAQVQAVLDDTVAFGISALAKAPIEKPIDLQIKLTLGSQTNAATARSLASAAARAYIDSLPIEDNSGQGTIIFYELVSRIIDAHIDIVNCSIQWAVSNNNALLVDLQAQQGEKFYLRSIEVL